MIMNDIVCDISTFEPSIKNEKKTEKNACVQFCQAKQVHTDRSCGHTYNCGTNSPSHFSTDSESVCSGHIDVDKKFEE